MKKVIALLLISTWLAMLVWRRIGARGEQLRMAHGMWLALLLSLMLPAHLASDQRSSDLSEPCCRSATRLRLA